MDASTASRLVGIDTDGDGLNDTACGFDTTGDGKVDSFAVAHADSQNPAVGDGKTYVGAGVWKRVPQEPHHGTYR